MFSNKKIVVTLLAVFCSFFTRAQEIKNNYDRGEYSLVFSFGGGLSGYCSNPGVPSHLNTEVSRFAPAYTFRLMWYPDHRLRFGVESGWSTMYSYRINDDKGGKLKLNSVPLMIVWSMNVGNNINIFAGSGNYFLTTKLDYAGKTTSSTFSLGWMLAASYIIPVKETLFFTPELKWFHAVETNDQSISLQLIMAWKIFKW
jgi:hypothetical protein